MKSLRCLAFITFCLFLFSCSKDNEYMADDEITNNKDLSDKNQSDKNQSDTSSKNQTFYFRMESQVPPLGNKMLEPLKWSLIQIVNGRLVLRRQVLRMVAI